MKIFTSECCDELLKQTGNIESGYNEGVFHDHLFQYLPFEIDISLNNVDLEGISSKSDLDDSMKIFDALKHLDLVQANDRRLWVTLTHTRFLTYTRNRWDIRADSSEKNLIQRFHYEGAGLETRMRNSISRLWWAARLSYDEKRDDKYELTRLLWAKQDIFQNLVERSYGTYGNVVRAFLQFYADNPELKEDQLRGLFTGLNAIGGVKPLVILSESDITGLLVEVLAFLKKRNAQAADQTAAMTA